ncbi:YceI family protein [Mycobacterium sp. WMMD1722]|uniref:YceI family protein n=1 Tax=Mycobacterium sp. WMMD1722 TaxID=3404117 RepID=UPI003BF6181F
MSRDGDVVHDPALAGDYRLAREASSISFSNKTFWGALTVNGSFTDFDGGGSRGADGAVTGQVVIRTSSLTTGSRKRDEHLRSADFFAVTEYPEIKAVVTGARPAADSSLELQATLTVKDRTQPIVLPADVSVVDGRTVQVRTRISVERETFGVTGNLIGMVGATTTLVGRLVFRRADSPT